MHDDLSAGRAGWLVPDLPGRQRNRGPSGPLFLCCIYDEVGVVGETMRRGVIVYSARPHIAGAGRNPRGARCGKELVVATARWRGSR